MPIIVVNQKQFDELVRKGVTKVENGKTYAHSPCNRSFWIELVLLKPKRKPDQIKVTKRG